MRLVEIFALTLATAAAAADSHHGGPPNGNPYGTSTYGNSTHGNSTHGNSTRGNSTHSNPTYGSPWNEVIGDCKTATDPRSGKQPASYDYVIVGAGPAGFVLANQLSANCNTSVLLLEAGKDTSEVLDVYIPGFAGLNEYSNQTYNYYVTPQVALNGLQPHLAQGFGYGGGTSVNYMEYSRASKSIYNKWANITGNDGFAWESLIEDFKATVTFQNDTVKRDWAQVIDYSAYGDGPLNITQDVTLDGFDPNWNTALQSTLNLTNVDFSSGVGTGVSYGVWLIAPDDRRRSYAYPAYGEPVLGRTNLKILPSAYVTKINFNGTRAQSVTFTDTTDNSTYLVSGNEIILSGGAIQSPKLLKLSGVGPADELESHGIPVVLNATEVGLNLVDHNYGTIEYQVTDPVYTISEWANVSYLWSILDDWNDNGTGPLANAPAASYAVFRTPESAFNSSAAGQYQLSLPSDVGNLQMQYANVRLLQLVDNLTDSEAAVKIMSCWVALTQPEASGWVKLNGTDPFNYPLINTNYFGAEGDFQAVLWGMKQMRAVINSDIMKPLVVKEVYPGSDVSADEDLIEAIRRGAQSYHHPQCTCAMGKVVDSNFRVMGLEGLRIVDASVFPGAVNVPPTATVYAMAHMAARQILQADAGA